MVVNLSHIGDKSQIFIGEEFIHFFNFIFVQKKADNDICITTSFTFLLSISGTLFWKFKLNIDSLLILKYIAIVLKCCDNGNITCFVC